MASNIQTEIRSSTLNASCMRHGWSCHCKNRTAINRVPKVRTIAKPSFYCNLSIVMKRVQTPPVLVPPPRIDSD